MITKICSKCESSNIKDSYNQEKDNLTRLCMNCGYTWEELNTDIEIDSKARILEPISKVKEII